MGYFARRLTSCGVRCGVMNDMISGALRQKNSTNKLRRGSDLGGVCRCSLMIERPNGIWQMECSIPPAGSNVSPPRFTFTSNLIAKVTEKL
jgi:hypothetical protein